MLQHTWLTVTCSKDLASLSQAASRTQRSILDLFSSLLLKISILCLCPSSSTPLGQQDTSLHDITHWPRLWHTFLFRTPSLFFILFFSLSPSAVFISRFQDPDKAPSSTHRFSSPFLTFLLPPRCFGGFYVAWKTSSAEPKAPYFHLSAVATLLPKAVELQEKTALGEG